MRPPRPQFPGAIYHVTCRAVARRALFRDDVDRSIFCALFGRLRERHRWPCFAACLMTTHFHLLIETVEADVAKGMHWLNGLYAQTFNRRHTEVGHVFEGRYESKLVLTEEHFLSCVRYIAMNPVEAGVCERPEDWYWSSYAVAFGTGSEPALEPSPELFEHFGRDRVSGLAELRRFVERADDGDDVRAA